MNFLITPRARDWLQDKGAQITLDPMGGGGGAGPGRAQAVPGAPRQKGYHCLQVDGVKIFMHHGLAQVADSIRIDLGGFWKLRWLKVSGAAPLSTCSFGAPGERKKGYKPCWK